MCHTSDVHLVVTIEVAANEIVVEDGRTSRVLWDANSSMVGAIENLALIEKRMDEFYRTCFSSLFGLFRRLLDDKVSNGQMEKLIRAAFEAAVINIGAGEASIH